MTIVLLLFAGLFAAAGGTGVVDCVTGKAAHPGRTWWGSAVCLALAIGLARTALGI